MGLKKELKKVLEFISKKMAKKQQKKAKKAKKAKRAKGVSLAEYAKNKMLLDMQSKMASGGGGAPLTKLTANFDTESMKRDMQELKEKNKDQQKEYVKVANDLSRAVSGIEQYKEQLQLEHQQRVNPRSYGELLMIEELPEVIELKNQVLLLENEKNRANIEKQMAIDNDDKPRIEHFIKQEVDIVSAITKEKKLLASARKKAKEITEEQLMKQQQAAFNRARREAENESDDGYAPSRVDAPSKMKVRPKNPVGRPPVGSKAFLGDKMERAADAEDLQDQF